MATINITITESSEQIVAGIPKFITISTDIYSTIFYTLNGTTPDLTSEIYVEPILLPTNILNIQLRVMATDGDTYSSIESRDYFTNILDNARLPHSSTDARINQNLENLYPFGTNETQPNSRFYNPANTSVTMNDPSQPQVPSGYDGEGNLTGFTNKSYDLQNYEVIYNTHYPTGTNIGNLPATVTMQQSSVPPEESLHYSKTFDPRALVIFQDSSKENPMDPPLINRQYFCFENDSKTKDGVNYFNTGLDSPTVMGSFVKSHYNPRDNTITYYYLDTHANKWIISKTPYQPGEVEHNFSNVPLSKNTGAGFVFKWYPFARRILF